MDKEKFTKSIPWYDVVKLFRIAHLHNVWQEAILHFPSDKEIATKKLDGSVCIM